MVSFDPWRLDSLRRRPIAFIDRLKAERCTRGRMVLIDDDPEILSALLDLEGYACESYTSALEVLAANQLQFPGPW